MKILIVEDDYTSRIVLHRFLLPFGETEIAVTGNQAVSAFAIALKAREPFDLVCLDIMLPGMDGLSVLRELRSLESAGTREPRTHARVVMTTALNDKANVVEAIKNCDGYLVKPIDRKRLAACLKDFGFVPSAPGAA
jgi:two-component system chemotaxis response regulator CheY